MKKIIDFVKKYKYPALMLLVGVVIMLLPTTSQKTEGTEENGLLSSVLSCSEGVGEAHVLISENGVVVVCSGADSAEVRLDVMRAVRSYTGFGAEKITILKLSE